MWTNDEMQDKLGQIHNIDCLEFIKQIPDKYFEVIYIDPPYFEVKGEFDFIWKSFDDYLQWAETLAVEFKRILADNGSLFIWGHAKKIAYTQVIFDKHFNLENSLVWEKKDSMQYQYYSPDLARSFNTHNERCLFYSSKVDMPGIEVARQIITNPFAEYLKSECISFFGSVAEFRKYVVKEFCLDSAMVNRWFDGDCLIQPKYYEAIRTKSNNVILRREYEDLRREYGDLRRPFNNYSKLTDVLKFSQQSHTTRNYDHPTQKPPTLTGELLRVVTRADSKVYIPFCGSGTEAEQCESLQLKWVATEINPDYVAMANKRLEAVQGALF